MSASFAAQCSVDAYFWQAPQQTSTLHESVEDREDLGCDLGQGHSV